VRQKKPPRCIAAGGGSVYPHREVCARGSLLILAPWNLDTMGCVGAIPADSDYSRFHNLNTLAAEICAFEGEAKIKK